MLRSIIGELRVGTSPCPVMATRLIVPEEQLRAAGRSGELPLGPYTSAGQRPGEKRQALVHAVIDTAMVVRELLVPMRDAELV